MKLWQQLEFQGDPRPVWDGDKKGGYNGLLVLPHILIGIFTDMIDAKGQKKGLNVAILEWNSRCLDPANKLDPPTIYAKTCSMPTKNPAGTPWLDEWMSCFCLILGQGVV